MKDLPMNNPLVHLHPAVGAWPILLVSLAVITSAALAQTSQHPPAVPAPMAYDPSAYELAPQFQQDNLPWKFDDLKKAILARATVEKQRHELDVYYYRIGYTIAYPLPMSQRPTRVRLPAGIAQMTYPWLTWMSWDLEERWRILETAWRRFRDREAGALLQRELAALDGWDHFYELNDQVSLVTSHLAASLALALSDPSGWDPDTLSQTRAAAEKLIERDVWPWFQKNWDIKQWTPQQLGNIPLIALARGAELARVIRSPRQEALDQRMREALQAWRQFRLGEVPHTEGVAYDGYLMDSLTGWLARLPDRAGLLQENREALRTLATQAMDLTLPGRADLQAPLGDVEPEMTHWATVLLRLAAWYEWNDAGWLLRRIPLNRLRAEAWSVALETKDSLERKAAPPRAGLREHPNAVTLRTGWDRDDLLAVLGFSRGKMGHLHPDVGQVTLGWQGRFWITDPGYQQYRPGEERAYTLGLQAHNAPVINGVPQTRRAGRLLLLETNRLGWLQVRMELSRCFTNLAAGASVEREVWLIPDGGRAVAVRDTFGALGTNAEVTTSWQGGTHLAWAFRDGWARLSNGKQALWVGTCPGTLDAQCLDRHPGSRGPLTLVHRQTLPDGTGCRWWVFWCDAAGGWKTPSLAADGRRLKLQTPGDQAVSWQIE